MQGHQNPPDFGPNPNRPWTRARPVHRRGHAPANLSSSQTRQRVTPSFQLLRIFHQLPVPIKHQRVPAIQNRQRRKHPKTTPIYPIQRPAVLQKTLARGRRQARNQGR